jgi:hypothetical protein
MDTRFGTQNVRSFYMAASLTTVRSELAKYNLDLVAIQEVRWEEDDSQLTDEYIFFYGNGDAYHHLRADLFVHKGIVTAVKGTEFISDRILYITLTGRWCDIVLNVHKSPENKSDDMKDDFYKEIKRVFHQFPKYHVEILSGDSMKK